ncbi:MAG: hypothetical protein V1859_09460 [archaeon]
MKSPRTMYVLAKEIGSNWDTVRKNVLLLQDLGIVAIENQKVQYIHYRNRVMGEDTIAGLPIEKHMKNKVYALAKKFLDVWQKENKERPLKNTILQKALVEIADAFPTLNIPRGWYLYGKIVLVKVTEDSLKNNKYSYNFSKELKSVNALEKKIQEIVKKYTDLSVQDIILDQYNRYRNQMYLVKTEIEKILCTEDLNKNKDKLSKLLYELVFNFDLDKHSEFSQEMFGILKDAITILITRIQEEKKLDDFNRNIFLDLFKSIWRTISVYNLYHTRQGDFGYDAFTLNLFFQDKANFYKQEFIDQCDSLGFSFT